MNFFWQIGKTYEKFNVEVILSDGSYNSYPDNASSIESVVDCVIDMNEKVVRHILISPGDIKDKYQLRNYK